MRYSTPNPNSCKTDADIAVRNLGIISQRALWWYRYLPQSVRNFYDAEDMIAEVVLHVVSNASKYLPKCKESTWVWWVAERRCLSILSHYNRKKINVFTVELDDKTLPSTASIERRRMALDAVERVLEYSSDRVLNLIEQLLDGSETVRKRFSAPNDSGQWVFFGQEKVWISNKGDIQAGSPALMALIQDLRESFQRCSASLDDFRMVMHDAVA